MIRDLVKTRSVLKMSSDVISVVFNMHKTHYLAAGSSADKLFDMLYREHLSRMADFDMAMEV